jgi:hypothetical protein
MLFGGTEIEAQLCWKENVRSKIVLLGLTIPIAFFYILFRVSRRGNGFFPLFSLIDILITLVGSM